MPPKKRQFPHVDQIKDTSTQSATRLLFDKIFGVEDIIKALQDNLKTAEGTISKLQGDLTTTNRKLNSTAIAAAPEPVTSGGAIVPPGSGGLPPTEPGGDYPNYASRVAQAKADLIEAGISISGECGGFQITKLAAYRIHADDPRIGLLSKPSGNNCDGYAVDILVFNDGMHFDVLSNAGTDNDPIWLSYGPVEISRWRTPIPGAIS